MKNYLRQNIMSLLLVSATIVWTLSVYDEMPQNIPKHFDIFGNPDSYGSKFHTAWLMPFLSLVVVVYLGFLSKYSPKLYQLQNSEKSIAKINLIVTSLLCAIHTVILLKALNPSTNYARLMGLSLSGFMIFCGNYLSKLERNFVIGVRTPWTLASSENWHATHRFSAKQFVIFGLISSACTLTIGTLVPAVVCLIAASILSSAYSFYFYFKNERHRLT